MDDRLTKKKWLDAGLRCLAADGAQGLRIMPIAQHLGVTKGSFYWHFADLEAYHAALVEEWEFRLTDQIVAEVEKSGGPAETRLRRLAAMTVAADPRLTLAMRSWSLIHPAVRSAVDRVDEKRLGYLAKLLEAMGWGPSEAAALARWSYSALIGYFQLGAAPLAPGEIDLILGTLRPR